MPEDVSPPPPEDLRGIMKSILKATVCRKISVKIKHHSGGQGERNAL